jgi:hypothetical protein
VLLVGGIYNVMEEKKKKYKPKKENEIKLFLYLKSQEDANKTK